MDYYYHYYDNKCRDFQFFLFFFYIFSRSRDDENDEIDANGTLIFMRNHFENVVFSSFCSCFFSFVFDFISSCKCMQRKWFFCDEIFVQNCCFFLAWRWLWECARARNAFVRTREKRTTQRRRIVKFIEQVLPASTTWNMHGCCWTPTSFWPQHDNVP